MGHPGSEGSPDIARVRAIPWIYQASEWSLGFIMVQSGAGFTRIRGDPWLYQGQRGPLALPGSKAALSLPGSEGTPGFTMEVGASLPNITRLSAYQTPDTMA